MTGEEVSKSKILAYHFPEQSAFGIGQGLRRMSIKLSDDSRENYLAVYEAIKGLVSKYQENNSTLWNVIDAYTYNRNKNLKPFSLKESAVAFKSLVEKYKSKALQAIFENRYRV